MEATNNVFLISENIAFDDYTKKRIKELNRKLEKNEPLNGDEIVIVLQAYARMFSIVERSARAIWQGKRT